MTLQGSPRFDTEGTQKKRNETNAPNDAEEECPQLAKKARLSSKTSPPPPCRLESADKHDLGPSRKKIPSRWLIDNFHDVISSKLPPTLSQNERKVGHDLQELLRLLKVHGLRTTKILSPREAVSIYKDSCRIPADEGSHDDASFRDGKEFLLVTLGVHPEQKRIELEYEANIKNTYCLILFCKKILEEVCNPQYLSSPKLTMDQEAAIEVDEGVQRLLRQIERTKKILKDHENSGFPLSLADAHVNDLIESAVDLKGKRRYRKEEWRKEYQRICVSNSTASNACVYLLQIAHGMCIKDVYFKFNRQEPKYERITIYLFDPSIDEGRRPGFFLFLPGLHTILTRGPQDLVSDMIDSFWTCVIRNGYYPTTKLKEILEPQLTCFFLSGLSTSSRNSNLPLPLKANFIPKSPLSIYLHGKPGAGTLFYFVKLHLDAIWSNDIR